jgi:hypothetical protein
MNRAIKIFLLTTGILFLVGCQNLRWNWSDNRKRIKPGLYVDDEFRQSDYYKEVFEAIVRDFIDKKNAEQQRNADQQKVFAQDPNQPFMVMR